MRLWGFAHRFQPRYAPTARWGRLANLGHPSSSYGVPLGMVAVRQQLIYCAKGLVDCDVGVGRGA